MDNEQIPNNSTTTQNSHKVSRIILIGIMIAIIGLGAAYILTREPASSVDTADITTADVTANDSSRIATSPIATPSPASVKISVAEPGKIILTGGYADPTVTKTTTGYRMYVNRQSGGPGGYMTYTSTDGTTWTKEKDSVISGAATGRAVTLTDGIRFYYPGAQPIKPSDPPANIYSAFSTDGVTFKKDTTPLVSPKDADHYLEGPTVFQLPDKSWRMYFNENSTAAGNQRDGIIWGASSKDGTTWTRDTTSTLEADKVELGNTQQWQQVLHPFVMTNPKGGYIMFYNSHSEIFAASSTDGLTWTKLGKVGIHGADIDGYFQEDGTIRVYYGDFSEATQGVVYTGVLKVQ